MAALVFDAKLNLVLATGPLAWLLSFGGHS